MGQYALRRLLLTIPTLLGVTLVIFVVMRVVPGDPAMIILGGGEGSTSGYTQADLERVREQLGLNKPIPVQYLDWLAGASRLDFGTSLRYSSPVSDEILHRMPLTLELTALAIIIGLGLGLPIGMLSATHQNSQIDYGGRVISSVGLAVPSFWAGTLMILVLSRLFGWVPPLGYVSFTEDPAGHLQQIVPPALVLGFGFAAYVARMSRAQVLEVLREDFVRTARAKGLRAQTVLVRHALKNALLPVVTLAGLHVGVLLGGIVTIELIFSLPGLGRLLLDALTSRDYPLIQALVLLLAAEFLIINLMVDLLYSWLDPRIRYT